MAVAVALGVTSMSDIAVLGHLEPVRGAAPSDTTARRTLELADPRTLGRVVKARAGVRRHVWELLGQARVVPVAADRGEDPDGLAGHHMDASLITAHLSRAPRPPTRKGSASTHGGRGWPIQPSAWRCCYVPATSAPILSAIT
jgi:hypothetical protein